MKTTSYDPERMQCFQRRDEHGGFYPPPPAPAVIAARRQRRLDALKTVAAGVLWIAAIWGGILLVFWGLAR